MSRESSELRSVPGARDARARAALVVGVGVSQDRLEGFERCVAHLPVRAGLTVVVVQQGESGRPGLRAEHLARHTSLCVVEAIDGMELQPDRVYLGAPGQLLMLQDGLLRVHAASEMRALALTDALFGSLAEEHGARAVAILFAGPGADGGAGLRAVKQCGGLTLAPAGRGRGAGERDAVDHLVAPEEMPAVLLAHAGACAADPAGGTGLEAELLASLHQICSVLRQHAGHDFSNYKEGTLLRRIRRRQQILQVASAGDYLRLLEQDGTEARELVKALLIGVTQFFRDPDAFHVLARQVMPRIVQAGGSDAPVRIWVPGCASGEEAYSIAILAREHLERLGVGKSVQIFATDLDAEMLAQARQGRYPRAIAGQIAPERLARFFVHDGQTYQATKELREMCIFAQHSLIRDPPFSQLDLVSCRNVLIYLRAELQKKLFPLFHYALRPGGFLFLGPSEGIAGNPDLFEPLDKNHRIFQRKEVVTRPLVEFPLATRGAVRISATSQVTAEVPQAMQPPREKLTATFERLVLEEYSWPCVVVDERGDIVLVAGPAARYLQLPAGTLTSNLLEAVRGTFRTELRAALQVAAQTGRRIVRDRVAVDIEDVPRQLRIIVRPMPVVDPGASLFLVVLQERLPAEEAPAEAAAAQFESRVVQQLESELRWTRAELKATVEELEAANEELKSWNEELTATNEELQSANEELQTSKEELQSLNEELETVNAELRQKLEELDTANGDLQNLFASTDIATIFLDRELRIVKFTPAATALFHLMETDAGRPIEDFAPRFEGQDLVADAREVLRTQAGIERQTRAAGGERWFMLRALPYRTVENLIAGVVVTFVDISQLKRVEEALRQSEERFRVLVEGVKEYASFMLAPDGTVASWNAGAERLKGYPAEEIIGQHFSRLFPEEQVRAGKPHRMLETAAATGRAEDEGWRLRGDGSRFWASTLLAAIRDESGELRGFVKVTQDCSERRRLVEEAQRQAALLRLSHEAILVWRLDDGIEFWNRGAEELYGFTEAEARGRLAHELLQTRFPRPWREIAAEMAGRGRWEGELVHRTVDGRPVTVYAKLQLVRSDDGVERVLETSRDVTERKAMELRLAQLAAFPEENPSPIVELDLYGQVRYANPAAHRLFPDLREQGGAHPWLSGWEALVHPTRDGSPAARSRVVKVDDRSFHQVFTCAPEGREIRVYSSDITERQRVEDALKCADAALRAANEELREADRRKDEFLATLSHELRNPLAPICNSLHILEQAEPGGDQARRAQAVIRRQVGQLARLVDDLLDVTRISSNKVKLQRQRLELNELVRRTAEDQRSVCEKSGVRLAVALAPEPLFVNGDWERLTQIVGNLLQNAAKFTPRGGAVRVEVAADRSARCAVIRVVDTGIGMAPEVMARLFQPFMQADTTLDRSKGGLGLGLSLVKGLVELHGGEVSAESDGPGRGSTFVVRLPQAETLPAAPAAATSQPAGQRRRVLIIEDNADAADSLRDVLVFEGHEVEVAYSGPQGLEVARRFRPEFVLCDIGLPGMDGYEVARAFRADATLADVHLVALTGYALPEDRQRVAESGFARHLAKPPGLAELCELLGTGASSGAAPHPAAPAGPRRRS